MTFVIKNFSASDWNEVSLYSVGSILGPNPVGSRNPKQFRKQVAKRRAKGKAR